MARYLNPYTDFGFKKLFGEEASKDLLRETERTILSVALAVGFSTHSAFTKAFRRYEGQTPSAYRRGVENGK